MPQRRTRLLVFVIAASLLLVPVAAQAIFATMPVIDWTAIARIGQP